MLIILIILIATSFHEVIGNCSSAPTTCKIEVSTSFLCRFSHGVYPDALDCRVFHYCKPGYDTSTRFECPTGFIFNSRLHMCEVAPANVTDICAGRRVECENIENREKLIPFPFHQAYSAYCSQSGQNDTTIFIQPFMRKCDFDDLQEFIAPDYYSCRFICLNQGYFPNPANCLEYFYCDAKDSIAVTMNCPPYYVFDGTMCTRDQTKCEPLYNL